MTPPPEDIRVAVLMGGPSAEAEVSLKSGGAVAAALREAGFAVDEIAFDQAQLPPLPDAAQVVFPALHGHFGEDGQIQALLEAKAITFVGSGSAASRLMMDKQESKKVLEQHGLPVIPGHVVDSTDSSFPWHLQLPLVVKPNGNGSSFGLSKVVKESDWADALEAALQYDPAVLVEECIPGVELTVGLLHGEALPVVEIVPPGEFYDYDAKYTYEHGKTEYHCPPSNVDQAMQAQLQELAVQAAEALDVRDMARIDFLLDRRDGRAYILEANSIPGFTGTSLLPKAAAVAGIGFPELCRRLVLGALEREPAGVTTA